MLIPSSPFGCSCVRNEERRRRPSSGRVSVRRQEPPFRKTRNRQSEPRARRAAATGACARCADSRPRAAVRRPCGRRSDGRSRAARRTRRTGSRPRRRGARGARAPRAEHRGKRLLGLARCRQRVRALQFRGPSRPAARVAAARERPRSGARTGPGRAPRAPRAGARGDRSPAGRRGRVPPTARRTRHLEHLVGKLEQAHEVRDRDAALADAAADLLLGQPELVDERRAGAGGLDRVQVLPRHVLDQRKLEALALRGRAHDRGNPSRPASCAARQRRSPAISS